MIRSVNILNLNNSPINLKAQNESEFNVKAKTLVIWGKNEIMTVGGKIKKNVALVKQIVQSISCNISKFTDLIIK